MQDGGKLKGREGGKNERERESRKILLMESRKESRWGRYVSRRRRRMEDAGDGELVIVHRNN